MTNIEDWNKRVEDGEARRSEQEEKLFSINVTGTIMVDVDETVELYALNEQEAERLAREAIDVTELVEEVAEDLDFEVTIIEEKN